MSVQKSFLLELTQEQANALLGLVDIAVKSAGLQVAEAGVFFHRHVNEAIKKSEGQEKHSLSQVEA